MGEIADMMLEGVLCQWCGEYMGDGIGYPTICRVCQIENDVDEFGNPKKNKLKKKRLHGKK